LKEEVERLELGVSRTENVLLAVFEASRIVLLDCLEWDWD
jgi:hypothetical protein